MQSSFDAERLEFEEEMQSLPQGWHSIRKQVLVVGRNISLESALLYVQAVEGDLPELLLEQEAREAREAAAAAAAL